MSRGLEALKELVKIGYLETEKGWQEDIIAIEDINDIEKELKALEIIKEKGNFINLEYDKHDDKYYIYDNELYMHNEITKEEYDLLKGVLTDD